jgi:hypothetical protein
MSGRIDRMAGCDIQRCRVLCAVLALAWCAASCKKEPPPAPDSATNPPPPESLDAGAPADAAAPALDDAAQEGPDAGAEMPDAGEAPDGGDGGDEGLSAVGKAPRGHDIGLSRDAAANRARKELLKLLREKGVDLPGGKLPEGVTIEKFWVKGKFVYAEARYRPPAQALNQPPASPSKGAADGQPDAKGSPQEGTGP